MSDAFGTIVTRAANRQHKPCAFKRDMLERLAGDYDLDDAFRLHTGILIVARLSQNVDWTPEYWAWKKYRKEQEEQQNQGLATRSTMYD